MKKILFGFIPAIIVISLGAFYGGMKYGQKSATSSGFIRQNFQNLSEEERQQFVQRGTGVRSGGDFISGEVIEKDEQSLTLKTSDGGSRIIFFSDQTEINKFADGTIGDVEKGKTISIRGQKNQDNSITAQSIQIGSPMTIRQ